MYRALELNKVRVDSLSRGDAMKAQKRLRYILTLALFIGITSVAFAQSNTVPLIGLLVFEQGGCRNEAFHSGLRELGYVEGSNFKFQCEDAGGKYQGLNAAAERLVNAKPDVLVVIGHAPTKSLQRATHTIPIVMVSSGDPVGSGFAQSLARPGGNVTGVTDFTFELNLKRLEMLKSAVPSLNHLSVLMHSGLPEDLASIFMRDTIASGNTLGFDVKVVKFAKLEELDRAYDEISRSGDQALLIAPMREIAAETRRIVELSRQYKLPTISLRKSYTIAGGLMSYGVDVASLHHRMAYFVDRILKGANPAELPIEQPTRFEFYVNLNTAKQMNLQMPESILLRADKVIE